MINTAHKPVLTLNCEFRRLPKTYDYTCAMIFGSDYGIHEVLYFCPRNETKELLPTHERLFVFIQWLDKLLKKGIDYRNCHILTNYAPIRKVCERMGASVACFRTFKATYSDNLEPNMSIERLREYYERELKASAS